MIHFTHTYNHAKEGDDISMYGLNPTFNPNIKYIVQIRNGREVIQSAKNFIKSHTPEFRNLFGGFPPPIPTKMDEVTATSKFLDLFTKIQPQIYFITSMESFDYMKISSDFWVVYKK